MAQSAKPEYEPLQGFSNSYVCAEASKTPTSMLNSQHTNALPSGYHLNKALLWEHSQEVIDLTGLKNCFPAGDF